MSDVQVLRDKLKSTVQTLRDKAAYKVEASFDLVQPSCEHVCTMPKLHIRRNCGIDMFMLDDMPDERLVMQCVKCDFKLDLVKRGICARCGSMDLSEWRDLEYEMFSEWERFRHDRFGLVVPFGKECNNCHLMLVVWEFYSDRRQSL